MKKKTKKVSKKFVSKITKEDRDKLVLDNLKYVYKFAASARYKGLLPYDDLIQEGIRGLVVAADRFNKAKRVPFIAFARIYIKKYIILAITQQLHLVKNNPDLSMLSLNAPMKSKDGGDSQTATYESFVADNHCIWKDIFPAEAKSILTRYLDRALKDLEKEVIIHRFGLDGKHPSTLDVISQKIGYTIPGVRMIELRAIGKLKQALEEDGVQLMDFVA